MGWEARLPCHDTKNKLSNFLSKSPKRKQPHPKGNYYYSKDLNKCLLYSNSSRLLVHILKKVTHQK